MEGLDARRRGMLTTEEWCNPVSTMCKRGLVGIEHESFENSGIVLGRHPALSSAYTAEVTQEAGVVLRRIRATINIPF